MSVVSTAISTAAAAASHALNAQAMNIVALKMKSDAATSIANMLEQAVQPPDRSNGTKKVDVEA